MKNSQIYRKPCWLHKVLYFILLALPVIILLQFAIGITNVIRSARILAKVRLFEERERVLETTLWILHQRQLAPPEELNLMKFPRDNTKAAALSLEFPEITEINLLKGEGEYTTIFTAAPSAEIHDGIAKRAPSLKDTISIRPPDFGNPTCQARVGLVEIEEIEYIFTFVEKDDETILMVSDPEKLMPLLTQIFHNAESGMPLFAEYFGQYTKFAAQLKFYDQSGENYYTHGDSRGRGWDDIPDIPLWIIPGRMIIQIFPRQETMIDLAEAAGSWHWAFAGTLHWWSIVKLVIAIILIFLLGHFSPRLHGFNRKKE